MVKFSDLNKAQQAAVLAEEPHIRVVAGAGSGKTRVLTMRIAYLVEQKHVAPYNILAITFTNKAAREMKERITDMIGEENGQVLISTIHSLCVRILRSDIVALGYPRNFTIVDQNDQNAILKEAYKEYGYDKKTLSYSSVLAYISNNKSEHVDPTQAFNLASGDPKEESKAKVYDYYVKRLKDMYALDFDDLILWTVDLFAKFPNIKEKWSDRFHYIHVDEFQDVDRNQYRLIRQLSCVHDNVYVVGDPDQTIYTWRGADVQIIMDFEKQFANAKTIVLDENYRSTNNILNGANSLIRNNRMRIDKNLFTNAGDGDKITHKTLESEDSEAFYVAKEIAKLVSEGKKYSDIAILYRSNYLSRSIEKVLMESRIPYMIFGAIRFYERAEIKDVLCYLRLLVAGDDLAFQRVINTPRRGIGEKTIENILELARQNHMTMYEVIKNGLYPKNRNVFDGFAAMIEKWRGMLENNDLEKLLAAVLDDSGYRASLEKENETERLENIKSLLDDIQNYQETYPESNLDEYLQMISLYTDRASDKTTDGVTLMTIHSAKGLEFDTVFVVGMSEGIFPSERTMAEGLKGIEEERRLAYVAYTRAKRHLYLTDNNGYSYVTQNSKTISRFIKEIDEKYVEDLSAVKRATPMFFDDISEKGASERKAAIPSNIKSKLKTGDHVEHTMYGKGVVVGVDGKFVKIAFPHPVGIKKMLSTHPSIKKIAK